MRALGVLDQYHWYRSDHGSQEAPVFPSGPNETYLMSHEIFNSIHHPNLKKTRRPPLNLPMFATFVMLYPYYPVWKLLRGDVPERGPLRSGSYCGAVLHRQYFMVPASAQLDVRPERKDGLVPCRHK